MGDTKQGRDKQADDEAQRQRERELEEALARGDESEPEPESGGELGALDAALETEHYPTTTHELIESYGNHEVESQRGWRSIAEVLAPVDDESYDSADDVRRRILGLLDRK